MRISVTVVRIITGVLFIFSGLVKAIDPRGLAYKMQEFFEAFSNDGFMPGLMHFLSEHALTFSLTIITLEVVIGAALLIGWKKKFTTIILLLLMLLFTFLTSYVLFSGKIRACGCFGDCIPITPMQTFIKDIILLVMAVFLLINTRYIRPAAKPMFLAIYILIAITATLLLQFYVMKHLPVIDCLPFKKGNNILELRKMPADAVPDKFDYTFVYEKDGQKKEFAASEIPDSTWTFSERKQVLLEKGRNNVPLINDFSLTNEEGVDLTDSIMQSGNEYYLMFLESPSVHTTKWVDEVKSLLNGLGEKRLYVVTSQRDAVKKILDANGINVHQLLTCDATAIKTAARSNPATYLMIGPVIKNKWGWADFDEITR